MESWWQIKETRPISFSLRWPAKFAGKTLPFGGKTLFLGLGCLEVRINSGRFWAILDMVLNLD